LKQQTWILSTHARVIYLANRAARSMIGYWHDTVGPSVCLSICQAVCPCLLWLNDTLYSKCLTSE